MKRMAWIVLLIISENKRIGTVLLDEIPKLSGWYYLQRKLYLFQWLSFGNFDFSCIVLFALGLTLAADLIASLVVLNVTNVGQINNDLKGVDTRRKRKDTKHRSTSSEGAIRDSNSDEGDKKSLELSSRDLTTSSSEEKNNLKSTKKRRGWKKWHRNCPPCPEDMVKKWRDPSIEWICGGYQRARRTFKSICMMQYRNCQDGTMFVKIYDHRCANDTRRDQPHGIHFFYDYKVKLSGESTETADSEFSNRESSSDS